MMKRLAIVLLALPLLAYDCGGEEPPPSNPFGMTCALQIRGAVSEDLWCIVAAYDYADLGGPDTTWAFELVAYRGMTEVGGAVGVFLAARPAVGAPYGWTASTSNVDAGSASRTVGDLAADPAVVETTHEAWAPVYGEGVGALSVTFSAIPPAGASEEQLAFGVHGTLSGTLAPLAGGGPVTFAATF